MTTSPNPPGPHEKTSERPAIAPTDGQSPADQTPSAELSEQELSDEQLENIAGGITGPPSAGSQYTQVIY